MTDLRGVESAGVSRHDAESRQGFGPRHGAASLLSAALALPGLAAGVAGTVSSLIPQTTRAESAPETGLVSIKYLYYRDWQAGGNRMRVHAPSLHLLMPLQGRFALEGSFVFDTMSGASPLYHDTLSGASGIGVNEYRKAGDFKLTRYFEQVAVGAGFAYSTEKDYISRALSTDVRISSADNNTTLALGIGRSSDDISSENRVARGESKRTVDMMIGITQVLSATDIVQSNVTYARGRGYYNDPYKAVDVRPDTREQTAWLTRWNHHFPVLDATLRASARYYRDTFGIRAITLNTEWAQAYGAWTLTPGVRYYTQSSADFYHGPPFPVGFRLGKPYSADARLSAFGALTGGVKIARTFADGWRADFKAEYYEQRNEWRRLVGASNGGADLKPMSAVFYQVGVSREF